MPLNSKLSRKLELMGRAIIYGKLSVMTGTLGLQRGQPELIPPEELSDYASTYLRSRVTMGEGFKRVLRYLNGED